MPDATAPDLRPRHVAVLDPLRGLASLSVAWFHFTSGNPTFLSHGLLKSSGHYGWLGVEMFFVISGFVIPFSLARSAYTLRDYPRFLAKRVVRLDPPYFVALAMVLLLQWASGHTPGSHASSLQVTPLQLFAHVGYWADFAGVPWLIPVLWTLAIEVQFYLVLGLLYPALTSSPWLRRAAFLLALVLPAFARSGITVFHFAPLFAAGYLTHRHRLGQLGNAATAAGVLACAASMSRFDTVGAAIVGASTALVIATADDAWMLRARAAAPAGLRAVGRAILRVLVGFGTVSYSLYLVHVPIGGRVINLAARVAHTTAMQLAGLALALATSYTVARLLTYFVELPSQRLASRIRFTSARVISAASVREEGGRSVA